MIKKKKRKLSYKKITRFILIISIIILLLSYRNTFINFYQSKVTGYEYDTIVYLKDYKIYNDVSKEKYSKTLEEIIKNNKYKSEYLNSYLAIDYQENQGFLDDINSFLSLGYNESDINTIYKYLKDESIKIFLDDKYIDSTQIYVKDISNMILLDYFLEDNLRDYLDYYTEEKSSYVDVVTSVNIGLHNDYYTNVNIIPENELDNILVLVNKYNMLDKLYEPNDLENINKKYGNGKLRKEAKEWFEKMCEGALQDGLKIYAGSGYRSFSYQNNLYNRYVNQDGKKKADTYAARAGYSEHQTGLAMDILNGRWDYISSNDKEYEWLQKNSYKYGYILRYPKDKEKITGYMTEEWHYRYVGLEVAKQVYDLNITYDEFVARNYLKK